jgi:tetrahydromethanopterin S-methyltransferase subunit G
LSRIHERLDNIERKLDEIVIRVSSLEYHFAGFQRELAAVNTRLDNLDRRAASGERRLDLIEDRAVHGTH